MKKSFLVIPLLLIPVALFAFGFKNKTDKESSIYSLSEDEIVTGNSCSKGVTRRNTMNNKTTISVSRFDGIDYVATINPKNEMINLTVSCKVTKGDLRLVLCDSESIVYEFDANGKDQTYNIPSSSAKYYLKVVGDNANYSVDIDFTSKKIDLPSFDEMSL